MKRSIWNSRDLPKKGKQDKSEVRRTSDGFNKFDFHMDMNDLKNSTAPVSTKTINRNEFDDKTDNIYEAISITAKRAVQINSEIKKELLEKLEEFATYSDSLEEVFENKEQIEVSKFYEKLPKPHALAVEEWMNDKIYFRNTEKDDSE